MSILAALNAKTLELRKSRDELAGSFQAVQSSATAIAKERVRVAGGDFSTVTATDVDATSAIQKAIKQVNDLLAIKADDAKGLRELEILQSLLPKQPSEDEIRQTVDSYLVGKDKAQKGLIGGVMKHLGEVYGPALDRGKASGIANAALKA